MKRFLLIAGLLTSHIFAGTGLSEYFLLNETDEPITVTFSDKKTISVAPKERISLAKIRIQIIDKIFEGLAGAVSGGKKSEKDLWADPVTITVLIPRTNNTVSLTALGWGGYKINDNLWFSHSGSWHRTTYEMGKNFFVFVDCWLYGDQYDFMFVISKVPPAVITKSTHTPTSLG